MYLPDRARYYLPLSDERVLRDRAGGRVESGRDRMLVPERLELIVLKSGPRFYHSTHGPYVATVVRHL
jgi:hypothetical protein